MHSPGNSHANEFAKHQEELLPYTAKYLGPKSLDIGSGSGLAALAQQQKLNISVTLTDVVDIRDEAARSLPFSIAKDAKLPFANNAFDSAYMQYVLHHVPPEQAESLLKEAFRVAHRLILVEEVLSQRTDRDRAEKFDKAVNAELHPGVDMPIYHYYTPEELLHQIKSLGHKKIDHTVIWTGSDTNGFLETHLFVFE